LGQAYSRGLQKREEETFSSFRQSNKKAENAPLSDQDINLKHYLKERLVLLLREEEIKWYERAKVKTF